jgi:hypothetical protein
LIGAKFEKPIEVEKINFDPLFAPFCMFRKLSQLCDARSKADVAHIILEPNLCLIFCDTTQSQGCHGWGAVIDFPSAAFWGPNSDESYDPFPGNTKGFHFKLLMQHECLSIGAVLSHFRFFWESFCLP